MLFVCIICISLLGGFRENIAMDGPTSDQWLRQKAKSDTDEGDRNDELHIHLTCETREDNGDQVLDEKELVVINSSDSKQSIIQLEASTPIGGAPTCGEIENVGVRIRLVKYPSPRDTQEMKNFRKLSRTDSANVASLDVVKSKFKINFENQRVTTDEAYVEENLQIQTLHDIKDNSVDEVLSSHQPLRNTSSTNQDGTVDIEEGILNVDANTGSLI